MLYRDFPSKTEIPLSKDAREAANAIWANSPDAYISLDANVVQTPNVVRVYTDGLVARAVKGNVYKDGKRFQTQVVTVPNFGYGCYKYADDINLTTRVTLRANVDEDRDDSIPYALFYSYKPIYITDIQLSMNFLLGDSYVKSVNAIPGSLEKDDEEPIFGLNGIPWETLLSEAGVGCTVTSERVGGRFDGSTTYTIEFPELEQGQSEPGLIELRSSESFVSRVTALHMAGGGYGLNNALIFGDDSVQNRYEEQWLMEDYQGLGEPLLRREAGNGYPEYWEIPVKKRNKELYDVRPKITHGTIIFSGPEEYISKRVVSYQCDEGSRENTVTTTEIVLADDGLSYTLKSETTYGEVSDDAENCVSQEPEITKSDLSATIRQVHSNMVARWRENKFLIGSFGSGFASENLVAEGVPFYDPEPGASVTKDGVVTYLETFFYAHLPLNSPIQKWDYVVHESEYSELNGGRGSYSGGLVPTNNHKIVTLDFSKVEPTTITFVPPDRSDDPNYEPDPENPEPEPFEENVLFLDCDAAIDKEQKERIVWTDYFPIESYSPVSGVPPEDYVKSSGMYHYSSNAWSTLPHPTDFGSMNDYMLPENEVLGLGGRKLWPDELPKWHETTEVFVIGGEEEDA